MIPAPAQGALAIEIRKSSKDIENIIESLKDIETEIQVSAERGFLDGINGSCHIPIGAYCNVDGENINLTGLYGDAEGKKLITKTIEGKASQARELGLELARLILKEYEVYEG
jgi:hydroxymethylbilane synthase